MINTRLFYCSFYIHAIFFLVFVLYMLVDNPFRLLFFFLYFKSFVFSFLSTLSRFQFVFVPYN